MWDGREMSRRLRADLLESDDSNFISQYHSYRYLNEAAANWVIRTNSLKTSETITTTADDDTYTLAPNHLNIYTKNRSGDRYIQYNNGSTNYFPTEKEIGEIRHQSTRPSQTIPGNFAVIDDPSLGSVITGTTTSAGAVSNGECTLTDSGGGFSGYASVGDAVHNETDVDSDSNGSYGVVVEVTSDTALVTALFAGGDADWTSGDSYVIVPQGRLQLFLDPPPSTSNHTMTIYYSARPAPVFAPFRNFRIQSQYIPEIIRDAKALYEFRGGDYNTGQADLSLYERKLVQSNTNYNKTFNRRKFGVNLKKRGY